MYYQITNGQAVEATLANTSNPQTFIAAQSLAWRHERGIYLRLIESDVTAPTADPAQDAIIVPRAVAQVEPIDAHLAGLRLAYATATRRLCGLLGIEPVAVLPVEQIKAAAAGVTSAEAMLQLLAIVTELSNIELKLCMADGADALERVV